MKSKQERKETEGRKDGRIVPGRSWENPSVTWLGGLPVTRSYNTLLIKKSKDKPAAGLLIGFGPSILHTNQICL
jgi:hypothetical protein